jgi:hypothetical protein
LRSANRQLLYMPAVVLTGKVHFFYFGPFFFISAEQNGEQERLGITVQ